MNGAVFGAVVVGAVGVTAAAAIISQWRAARAVIRLTQAERATEPADDGPVPYLLTEHALLLTACCAPCNDGAGTCSCGFQCGSLACMGGLSPATVEFLRDVSAPEGTDQ